MKKYGFIYIATNRYFKENIYKIGYTDGDVYDRVDQLYTTGIPVEFNISMYRMVPNAKEIEKRVHEELKEYRINKNREFFECDIQEIISALDNIATEVWEDFIEEHEEFIRRTTCCLTESYFEYIIEKLIYENIDRNKLSESTMDKNVCSVERMIKYDSNYFIKEGYLYYTPTPIQIGSLAWVSGRIRNL